MKRDFEEYYPLPWTVIKTKNGAFMVPNTEALTTEHWFKRSLKDGLIETFSTNAFPPRVAALEYAVQCANLMPEAVELLKSADEKLLALCRTCDNAMSDAGLGRFVDCKNCNVESLDTSIKELLAKLEGGAEDERD